MDQPRQAREFDRPIVGIVGGIAAGKSRVARLFDSLGCLVIDSDRLARDAYADPRVRLAIRNRWQIDPDDRRQIARLVFADENERRWLEGLIHPWIEARRLERMRAAPPSTRAFVWDSPLLIESGLAGQCDAVIFVDTPRDVRLTRATTERGWSEADFDRRENAQMPLEEKRRHATHVLSGIDSDDRTRASLEEVLRSVSAGVDPGL